MQLIALCRLGRDAEIRYTQNGTAVSNIALAYNYGRKDNNSKQPTQWIQAALFGKRAESLTQYLTKGTAIVAYLRDVHIEYFNKSDGTQGTALKAVMNDLEFAGGGQQRQTPQQGNAYRQQSHVGYAPSSPQPQSEPGSDGDLDDDIPF